MREPYTQWADGHIQRIKGILNAARDEHTGAVKERIDNVSQMRDVVDITKNLFTLSKVSNRPFSLICLINFYFRKPLALRTRTLFSSKRSPSLLRSSLSLTAGSATSSR